MADPQKQKPTEAPAAPEQKPAEATAAAPEEPKTILMEILTDGIFISDKSKLVKNGVPYTDRKLFKGEKWDLHPDDARMLDEGGHAKVVANWKK